MWHRALSGNEDQKNQLELKDYIQNWVKSSKVWKHVETKDLEQLNMEKD
jgi:hypothetical protein